jgi:hypothetical protein
MISRADSIPMRSQKGLQGQDILWTQFNDISFFIEDNLQENLYFQILKKLFPNIKLSKIFPLGGKEFVIEKAKKYINNKKKIFIVDNDFDEILKAKETLPNIFYLQRYCIENYLFEQNAIYELVREENPKIKSSELKSKFDISNFTNECSTILSELSAHFFLIMKFKLGLKFLKIEPYRDCDLKSVPKEIKRSCVEPFYLEVETALKLKNSRLKYSRQLTLAMKHFNESKLLINTPGKYLVNLLRIYLKNSFNFTQCSTDTFIYRLFKNCKLNSLTYLKEAIDLYIA